MIIHPELNKRLSKKTIKNKIWNLIDQKGFQSLLSKVDKFDYAFLKSLKGAIFNQWIAVIPKKTQRLTNPQFRYGLLRTLRTPITNHNK